SGDRLLPAAQRECDKRVTGLCAQLAAAPGCDSDELPSFDHVSARRGITAGFEFGLPKELAVGLVERMKLFVLRSAYEHQTAGGHDCAAEIFCSRLRDSPRSQLRIFA